MVSEQRQSSAQSDPKAAALARFFLTRLERLVQLRLSEHNRLSDEYTRLLNRAIYSTLCDCIDAGVGDLARARLRSVMITPRPKGNNEAEGSSVEPRAG